MVVSFVVVCGEIVDFSAICSRIVGSPDSPLRREMRAAQSDAHSTSEKASSDIRAQHVLDYASSPTAPNAFT